MPNFDYIVDDEPQQTTAHQLTPTQIMANAGIDASTHYLIQLHGNSRTSYEGKPTETIHMHEKMKFITVSTAPTPVS